MAVFLLAVVLFFDPFLGIFDRGATTTIAGVPLLYAYIFAAWALVIALTALVMESRARPDEPNEPPRAGAGDHDATDEPQGGDALASAGTRKS